MSRFTSSTALDLIHALEGATLDLHSEWETTPIPVLQARRDAAVDALLVAMGERPLNSGSIDSGDPHEHVKGDTYGLSCDRCSPLEPTDSEAGR